MTKPKKIEIAKDYFSRILEQKPASRTLGLLVASVLLFACTANGTEIRVECTPAFSEVYFEIIPEYEHASQNKTHTEVVPSRLQRGELDLVILSGIALDKLIKQGKVVADSRVDVALSSIGMAVRAGAPKPDISSVEAFKRTLLQADSIAYSAGISGIYYSTELVQRLGIADQVMGKSKRIEKGLAEAIAHGEVEMGFLQISELLAVPGIDYVGPLPSEIQKVSVYSAGVAVGAKEPDAARELIKFLASPVAIPAIKKHGLEPPVSQ